MTVRGLPRFAAQAAMLAMLAFVLLSRTLIPAGYMIAPAGGWPVLTLCEAPASPAPAHHEGHDPPAQPEPTCAYAALAAPALPPAPPFFASPPRPSEAGVPDRSVPASAATGPASIPPPSTGPPARV